MNTSANIERNAKKKGLRTLEETTRLAREGDLSSNSEEKDVYERLGEDTEDKTMKDAKFRTAAERAPGEKPRNDL